MKIAITGGTGFVGRNLARELVGHGHEVVLLARGADQRDLTVRTAKGIEFVPAGVGSKSQLEQAFSGCDAVAHLAGINRELGEQTYENVHVQGTRNVVEAAKQAGVGKVILLSFLRARPECGSAYHESKFAAEEIVRRSGLDYTIFKAGVIYGKGDHMLDHISHALYTFPLFLLVGFKAQPVRPLAVEDLVKVMLASLEGDLSRKTIAITGPEEMTLRGAVERIMAVTGRRPLMFPVPVWVHRVLAWFFERTMAVPLAAQAQVRILSESLVHPLPSADELPDHLRPGTPFIAEQIRKGLPEPKRFGFDDCLCRMRRIPPAR